MTRRDHKPRTEASAGEIERRQFRSLPSRLGLSGYAFVFVLGGAAALAGAWVWNRALSAPAAPPAFGATQSPTTTPPALSPSPRSYHDLLAMSGEDLAKVDVALTNLLCAKDLPGAGEINMQALLKRLDEWAAKVKFETERHLYRAHDARYAEHYKGSEARLRAEFLVQVLQEDCDVHYNTDRIRDVNFSNPKDLFILGMIDDANGGTCASMPVMYVAIGRRLGYPMKLVTAKTHLFCRWDGGAERFNIEGASNGHVDYFADGYYRTWPEPISDAEMASGEFLRSLTATEELSEFLISRGACFQANRRLPEAMAAYSEAYRLMPAAVVTRGCLLEASTLIPAGDIEAFAQQARAKGIGGVQPTLPPPAPVRPRGSPISLAIPTPNPAADSPRRSTGGHNP